MDEFSDLCTGRRFRFHIKRLFAPSDIVRSTKLYRDGYADTYSINRAKFALLAEPSANPGEAPQNTRFFPLLEYLTSNRDACADRLFRGSPLGPVPKSSHETGIAQLNIVEKEHPVTRTVSVTVSVYSDDRERRKAIHRLLLLCDSSTVATEVPILLERADFNPLAEAGVAVEPELSGASALFMDAIQIRGGLIHLMLYAPPPVEREPIEELTLAAVALSRATGLPLYDFKCAWFNESHYREFFPRYLVRLLAPPPKTDHPDSLT